jgi:hypothetical protein
MTHYLPNITIITIIWFRRISQDTPETNYLCSLRILLCKFLFNSPCCSLYPPYLFVHELFFVCELKYASKSLLLTPLLLTTMIIVHIYIGNNWKSFSNNRGTVPTSSVAYKTRMIIVQWSDDPVCPQILSICNTSLCVLSFSNGWFPFHCALPDPHPPTNAYNNVRDNARDNIHNMMFSLYGTVGTEYDLIIFYDSFCNHCPPNIDSTVQSI